MGLELRNGLSRQDETPLAMPSFRSGYGPCLMTASAAPSHPDRRRDVPNEVPGGQGKALNGAMAVTMALAAFRWLLLVTSNRSRVAAINIPPPATVWVSISGEGRTKGANSGAT